jgi:hypothetical protein
LTNPSYDYCKLERGHHSAVYVNIIIYAAAPTKVKKKSKAIPVTGRESP